MMLMMVVFCGMSAALFYASRVPAITSELQAMSGGTLGDSAEEVGRRSHIVFVMFTYTAPLLLAALIGSILGVWRWIERRR